MRAVRKAQGYVDAAESDYSDKLDNIFEIFKRISTDSSPIDLSWTLRQNLRDVI